MVTAPHPERECGLRAPRSLASVSRNVGSLARSVAFYCRRLGFSCSGPPYLADPALVQWLGLGGRVTAQRLRLGLEEIELVEVGASGRPYPASASAADLCFQHLAVRCVAIGAACARLRDDQIEAAPARFISTAGGPGATAETGGAVTLPAASGGVTAIKFRDPDGHPLELLSFPAGQYGASKHTTGIDHSAICVRSAERSMAFYAGLTGMTAGQRQVNRGAEQATLDGLAVAAVEVVPMVASPLASPHLELLAYQTPAPRRSVAPNFPADIASDRLVFGCAAVRGAPDRRSCFLQDPDGHFLVLRG